MGTPLPINKRDSHIPIPQVKTKLFLRDKTSYSYEIKSFPRMATRVNVMGSEAKHASVASVIDDYVETKSLEYMDRKCGVKENGNETATFQLRECRRTYYKPGVTILVKKVPLAVILALPLLRNLIT